MGKASSLFRNASETGGEFVQGLVHRAGLAGGQLGAPTVKIVAYLEPLVIDHLPLTREFFNLLPSPGRRGSWGSGRRRILGDRNRLRLVGLAASGQDEEQ